MRRSLLNVCAFRDADAASVHQLPITSVQLKITPLKVRYIADRPKFYTDKLKSRMVRKSM